MSNLKPFALEKRMATNTVNLDAMIPRNDFVSEASSAGGSPRTTIGLSDLEKTDFSKIPFGNLISKEKQPIGRQRRFLT